jgi:hypothetical protein
MPRVILGGNRVGGQDAARRGVERNALDPDRRRLRLCQVRRYGAFGREQPGFVETQRRGAGNERRG